MADPLVMVVEDESVWRTELAMMYSRILRGQSKHRHADSTIHPAVFTFATAKEAIDYLKASSRVQSRAVRKVDILSLDLNLKRSGGNGFDVLKAAVENGQKFATIAISGFSDDDDFRDQLSEEQYKELQSLRSKVESITRCECIEEHKHPKDRFGDEREQVARIEQNLVSRAKGNILRSLASKLRESIADLNGHFFCMHFALPTTLYQPCEGDWVAASARRQRARLNRLGIWRGVFCPLDEECTQADLAARLLFLVKPKNYFVGLSLQTTLEKPDPSESWLIPRPRGPKIPPSQAFLMLQLVMQGWVNQAAPSPVMPATVHAAAAELRHDAGNLLEISGLLKPTNLGWKKKGSVHRNEENLDVVRIVDGKEDGALKTRKHHLEKGLKQALGDVDYDVIECLENTYMLKRPGQVFIHRADK